jgi:hypothetical protein
MEQNNNTQLPKEVVEQIKKQAKSSAANFNYYPESDEFDDLTSAYITGATEWAQWKVKYDELLASVDEKIDKALHAERNKMQAKITASEVAWAKECQELKERAERMETALEWIKTYGPDQSKLGQAFIDKALKGKEVEKPKPTISNCGMCNKEGINQYLGNKFYLCDECFESYENTRDQPPNN